MRSLTSTRSFAAAAFAVAMFTAPLAYAQSAAPAPAPSGKAQTDQPSAAAPADIPDQKLDAAAQALQKVASLKENYQEQIAKAPQADRSRLAEEANGALLKAVTDQGLSVEEYSNIMQTAQADPQIRDKLLKRLDTKK